MKSVKRQCVQVAAADDVGAVSTERSAPMLAHKAQELDLVEREQAIRLRTIEIDAADARARKLRLEEEAALTQRNFARMKVLNLAESVMELRSALNIPHTAEGLRRVFMHVDLWHDQAGWPRPPPEPFMICDLRMGDKLFRMTVPHDVPQGGFEGRAKFHRFIDPDLGEMVEPNPGPDNGIIDFHVRDEDPATIDD